MEIIGSMMTGIASVPPLEAGRMVIRMANEVVKYHDAKVAELEAQVAALTPGPGCPRSPEYKAPEPTPGLDRAEKINALRGKYRGQVSSVDEFLAKKYQGGGE